MVGRPGGRLRLGPRRARHEEPGGGGGRGGRRARARRAGGPSGRAARRHHGRRGGRRRARRAVAVRAAPRQGPLRLHGQRGRRRGRPTSTGAASTACASPRRASSASRSRPTGTAGHASIPRIGDNALTKLAPLLAGDGRPPAVARASAGARRAARRARASIRRTPRPRSREAAETRPAHRRAASSRCSA